MEQREGESEHALELLLQSINGGTLFIRHLLVDLEEQRDQFKIAFQSNVGYVHHFRQRKTPVLSQH